MNAAESIRPETHQHSSSMLLLFVSQQITEYSFNKTVLLKLYTHIPSENTAKCCQTSTSRAGLIHLRTVESFVPLLLLSVSCHLLLFSINRITLPSIRISLCQDSDVKKDNSLSFRPGFQFYLAWRSFHEVLMPLHCVPAQACQWYSLSLPFLFLSVRLSVAS